MKRVIVVASLAIAAGVCAGLLARRNWNYGPVRFEPSMSEHGPAIAEGQSLTLSVTLVNDAAQPLVVSKILSSCGCLGLFSGETRVDEGFRFQARSKTPLSIKVATLNLAGPQEKQIGIEGRLNGTGAYITTHTTLRINVLGGLRAVPSEVTIGELAPGQTKEVTFTVMDGVGREIIPLNSPLVSHPDRMRVELHGIDSAIQRTRTSMGFVPRSQCTLKYTHASAPDEFRGSIDLRLKDSRFPPLRVPVVCRSSTPPLHFVVGKLAVFAGPANTAIERTVRFENDDDTAPGVIQVIAKSDGVDASIDGASSSGGLVILKIEPSALKSSQALQLTIGDPGNDACRATLEIVQSPGSEKLE